MNCVFAHAAYGVKLTQAEQDAVNKIVAGASPSTEDEDETGEPQEVLDSLLRNPHRQAAMALIKLLHKLQKAYRAPANTRLHYTGNADEHAAGSAVEADVWILGYGLNAFPDRVRMETALFQSFKEFAEWHTWVTGEV